MSDTTLPPQPSPEETPKENPVETKKGFFSPKYKTGRRIFFGITGLGVGMVFLLIILALLDIPPLSKIENPKSDLSTQILSADGHLLGSFFSQENRVNVQLNEISPHVVNALIATEDVRYYQHSGIDALGIPNILGRVLLRGKISGASTITMQLSRNLYDEIGRKRSPFRKLKEIIVSAIIERKFTKGEILTAYLNTVNIYGNAYGIEMASNQLFSKKASDLAIEEAALIVGMLKGQGAYNPVRKPEKAKRRRNTVLNQMVKYGFISNDPDATNYVNVDSLKEIEIVVQRTGKEHIKGLAPYFREHVRHWLKDWCRKEGYNLYQDGLKVYTTIDSRMQKHAETAVGEHLSSLQKDFTKHIKGREPYRRDSSILIDLMKRSERYSKSKREKTPYLKIVEDFHKKIPMTIFTWNGKVDTVLSPMDSLKYYSKFLETGFISIEPTSGYIKAWVGGINYEYFKYDHVAKGKRQVGSTFKPFVYAAAIDNGRTPCDEELNQPVIFTLDNGRTWAPKNSGGGFGGKLSLRRALATSVNMVTARLMRQIGPQAVTEMAYNCGIQSRLDPVPSLCLGTTDLNVMELVGAYGTFANKGQWIEPTFVARIEDRNGNVIYEARPKTKQALSEEKAYLMVDLLKGVVDEPGGTAGRMRFRYKFQNEIGGKTGTTQNHSDGWFVAVTPNLVSGVWVGCADRRMRFRSIRLGQGANMALPICALYMQKVYKDPSVGIPQVQFDRPNGFGVDLSCIPSSLTPTTPNPDPFNTDLNDAGPSPPATTTTPTPDDPFGGFD